ncbi:MAG: hypothetical protein V4773_00460, partial [Verrucomicrobiota bacterium]
MAAIADGVLDERIKRLGLHCLGGCDDARVELLRELHAGMRGLVVGHRAHDFFHAGIEPHGEHAAICEGGERGEFVDIALLRN